jgi:hypothetical protein
LTTKISSRLPPLSPVSALPAAVQEAQPFYALTMHLFKDTDTNTFALRLWDLAATTYPMTEFTMAYDRNSASFTLGYSFGLFPLKEAVPQ